MIRAVISAPAARAQTNGHPVFCSPAPQGDMSVNSSGSSTEGARKVPQENFRPHKNNNDNRTTEKEKEQLKQI